MTGMWSKLKKKLWPKLFRRSRQPKISEPASSSALSATLSDLSSAEYNSRSMPIPHSRSSSSSLSRFSRSISAKSSKKTCVICLGTVKSGQGQAIFTAECSHSFHFGCIANSVRHGNHICPICRSKWKDMPFQFRANDIDPQRNGAGRARVSPYQSPPEDNQANIPRNLPPCLPYHPEPLNFNDDEPLSTISVHASSPSSVTHSLTVKVKAFPEVPAIAASESVSSFAVLVGVQAPPLLDAAHNLERAPIDLVTVLDISGSMTGSKLAMLKSAVHFVIQNLGSCDRLSIVIFSSSARRIFPLRRMSDSCRAEATLVINSLSANGGTNIVEGLKKGVRVLEERHEQNPVASIILLSDGRDTYSYNNSNQLHSSQNRSSSDPRQVIEYLNLLPNSVFPKSGEARDEARMPIIPVHTFGFGSDHDSAAMHAISDVSGGTFSFIESVGMVQDSFARCIGGLLSVVVQELQLTVRSISPGVGIGSIPSGQYTSKISEGQQGKIKIGDMYADEEKEFLVYLSVPMCLAADDEDRVENTLLLDVTCCYKDASAKKMVRVEGQRVEIRRPKVLSPADVLVSLEVDRQRNRLCVAEGIAEAKAMAEMGNLEGAQAVLTNRISTLLSSASGQAGDGLCYMLEAELALTRERMASMEVYEHTGRAFLLSGLSSHSSQRATTRGDTTTQSFMLSGGGNSSNTTIIGYDTPSMTTMVTKSQNLGMINQVPRHTKSFSFTPRHG